MNENKKFYTIELGHKLIDRLYNSDNLSLKECEEKRDELEKLRGNRWKKKSQQLIEDFFMRNTIWSIEELKAAKFFLLDSDSPGFVRNLTLTILASVLLFFISGFVIAALSFFLSGEPTDRLFNWKTVPVWALYIFSIIKIEQNFYKYRKNSKYIDILLTTILFYISKILTVVTIIYISLSILVQKFSRIGFSAIDNYDTHLFFFFLVPVISWTIYYVFYINRDAFTKYINYTEKKYVEKNNFLKSDVVRGITKDTPTNISALADDLNKLGELKEKGLLTEEEFNDQKKKLLKQ